MPIRRRPDFFSWIVFLAPIAGVVLLALTVVRGPCGLDEPPPVAAPPVAEPDEPLRP